MAGAVLKILGAPPEIRTRRIQFLRLARMPVPPAGQTKNLKPKNEKPGDLAVHPGLLLQEFERVTCLSPPEIHLASIARYDRHRTTRIRGTLLR